MRFIIVALALMAMFSTASGATTTAAPAITTKAGGYCEGLNDDKNYRDVGAVTTAQECQDKCSLEVNFDLVAYELYQEDDGSYLCYCQDGCSCWSTEAKSTSYVFDAKVPEIPTDICTDNISPGAKQFTIRNYDDDACATASTAVYKDDKVMDQCYNSGVEQEYYVCNANNTVTEKQYAKDSNCQGIATYTTLYGNNICVNGRIMRWSGHCSDDDSITGPPTGWTQKEGVWCEGPSNDFNLKGPFTVFSHQECLKKCSAQPNFNLVGVEFQAQDEPDSYYDYACWCQDGCNCLTTNPDSTQWVKSTVTVPTLSCSNYIDPGAKNITIKDYETTGCEFLRETIIRDVIMSQCNSQTKWVCNSDNTITETEYNTDKTDHAYNSGCTGTVVSTQTIRNDTCVSPRDQKYVWQGHCSDDDSLTNPPAGWTLKEGAYCEGPSDDLNEKGPFDVVSHQQCLKKCEEQTNFNLVGVQLSKLSDGYECYCQNGCNCLTTDVETTSWVKSTVTIPTLSCSAYVDPGAKQITVKIYADNACTTLTDTRNDDIIVGQCYSGDSKYQCNSDNSFTQIVFATATNSCSGTILSQTVYKKSTCVDGLKIDWSGDCNVSDGFQALSSVLLLALTLMSVF